jgi:Calcineurin-like phosphoesterase
MTLVRVANQQLSLWQSSVAEVMRKNLTTSAAAEPDGIAVLDHPAVQATNDFVRARLTKADPRTAPDPAAGATDPHALNVYLSGLCFDIAQARVEGRFNDEAQLLTSYWPMSDYDPGFLSCILTYKYYWDRYNGQFLYNDWQKVGGNKGLNYGVIDWPLANDAKVAIIGDWGTNLYLQDSTALLIDLLRTQKPDVILHVGDIYYSGTPNECQAFLTAINEAFTSAGVNPVPVFTLPGNHDYYALGYGFYPMLSDLNNQIAGAAQEASYFCLRTADGRWQFLGMDTGYEDSNPLNQKDPFYAGPWLEASEIVWHKDKLDNFPGATILLSHHQLFSANSKINGMTSSESEFPYLNPMLLNVFEPYFRTKIAAWVWGHEHSLGIFQNGLFGLAKGRLVGASAWEELTSESPYTVNYPQVPYLQPTTWEAPANAPPNDAYLQHSYATIDLSTDPPNVSYYAFPSWYDQRPTNPQSTHLFDETLSLPSPAPQTQVDFGSPIALAVEGGLTFVGPLDWDGTSIGQYYPTIVGSAGVTLKLVGTTSGPIVHGSSIQIQTTENAAGNYSYLGAWSGAHCLYYYLSGYSQENWTICKLDPSDPNVYFGDAVYFMSSYFGGQWIAPTDNPYIGTNKQYLTTTAMGVPTVFTIVQP